MQYVCKTNQKIIAMAKRFTDVFAITMNDRAEAGIVPIINGDSGFSNGG